jgi:hypothetical protein
VRSVDLEPLDEPREVAEALFVDGGTLPSIFLCYSLIFTSSLVFHNVHFFFLT